MEGDKTGYSAIEWINSITDSVLRSRLEYYYTHGNERAVRGRAFAGVFFELKQMIDECLIWSCTLEGSDYWVKIAGSSVLPAKEIEYNRGRYGEPIPWNKVQSKKGSLIIQIKTNKQNDTNNIVVFVKTTTVSNGKRPIQTTAIGRKSPIRVISGKVKYQTVSK